MSSSFIMLKLTEFLRSVGMISSYARHKSSSWKAFSQYVLYLETSSISLFASVKNFLFSINFKNTQSSLSLKDPRFQQKLQNSANCLISFSRIMVLYSNMGIASSLPLSVMAILMRGPLSLAIYWMSLQTIDELILSKSPSSVTPPSFSIL